MRVITTIVIFLLSIALAQEPATAQSKNTVPLLEGNTNPSDLPSDFFVGIQSKWFLNVHNWTRIVPGKTRWFEPKNSDLNKMRSIGVPVIRLQIGVESLLFGQNCNFRSDQMDASCYERNFLQAHKSNWQQELAELEDLSSNPFVKMYVQGARKIQGKGFHVIVVLQDFFRGKNTDGQTLLHHYIEKDPIFQSYVVGLANRLTAILAANGISNFSFQPMNEPDYCRGGPSWSKLKKWQSMERRIIDGVRMAAPGTHVISSAICTAGDRILSTKKSYNSLSRLLPKHDIPNISYAIHFRNPRLIHLPEFEQFSTGQLSYPYKKMSNNLGKSNQARDWIKIYNSVKPTAKYYQKIFGEIATLSKKRGASIIVTEWSVSKSDYGLPREQRALLFKDILAAAKSNGVPIIYDSLFGKSGLGYRPDSLRTPDHNFDPTLLRLISEANKGS